MKKNRWIAWITLCILWLQIIPVHAGQSYVPYLSGGVAYLRFRDVASAVGCEVAWNEAQRRITMSYGTESAIFTVGSRDFFVNGTQIAGDAPVLLSEGTSYLALTDVQRVLKTAEVIWNVSTQVVTVTLPPDGFQGFWPKRRVTLYSYDGLKNVETTEDCIAAYGDGWHLNKPPLPYPLILVNRGNPVPNVVPVGNMITTAGTSYRLYADAAYALNDLLARAKAEGVTGLVITSAYRDYAYQKRLFDAQVESLRPAYGDGAFEMAKLSVSYPGTSEHETGLAVDIGVLGYGENMEHTAQYQWLAGHAAEYGFIVRYPKNKTEITQVKYEPWHFRYVGPKYALLIEASGLCYEEFFPTMYFA